MIPRLALIASVVALLGWGWATVRHYGVIIWVRPITGGSHAFVAPADLHSVRVFTGSDWIACSLCKPRRSDEYGISWDVLRRFRGGRLPAVRLNGAVVGGE